MISPLSAVFRTVPLYNPSTPARNVYKIHKQGNVHWGGQPLYRQAVEQEPPKRSLRHSVEERLGLPKRPARPLTAYFLFLNEHRPKVVAQNPKLKTSEVVSLISTMWKQLDDETKQKYTKEYNEQLSKYSLMATEYEQALTDENRRKLKEIKVAHDAKARELGKPKLFQASFIKFLKEQNDRGTEEPYIDFLRRVAGKWSVLSEAEKEKYKTSDADKDSYEKALRDWKSKMTELGHMKHNKILTDDDKKNRASLSRKARELGKPKLVHHSFLAFLKEQKDRGPKETYTDFLKRMSVKWATLNEAEKEKFKISAADKDKYEKALLAWETEMLKLGHVDLVRVESRNPQKKPKRKSK